MPTGIDRNKADKTLCLCVGCNKKALYRAHASQRGYCRLHKDRLTSRPMCGSTVPPSYYEVDAFKEAA